MRVSGLSSGIDVDSIVKEMMTAKREPLNKLNQQKQFWGGKETAIVSLTLS